MDSNHVSRLNRKKQRIINCVDEMFESDCFYLESLQEEAKRLLRNRDWEMLFFLLDYYKDKAKDNVCSSYSFGYHKNNLENVAWLIYENIEPTYKRIFKKKYSPYLIVYEDD